MPRRYVNVSDLHDCSMKQERGEASKTDKRRKEISSGIAPQSEEVIKAAKRDKKVIHP